MPEFTSFVLLAEMRTGSNFLEENLNLIEDVHCQGELFNPAFVGYPNQESFLGYDLKKREEDPIGFLEKLREQGPGIFGFRYFHTHDERVFDTFMDDPKCAKIILTRNPIDSFVSLQIARATGQWRLTNMSKHKAAEVHIDPQEFEEHVNDLQAFQVKVLNTLQKSGQTAFYIAYEDLQSLEITNGLAAYLSSEHRLDSLSKKLKKQNPSTLSEKVQNFDEVEVALAKMDRFNLNRTPNFEPRRGPMVPNYIAAAKSKLLFMPIPSGPTSAIKKWLCEMDDVSQAELINDFSQKTLRQWRNQNKGNRSFTVLRHPVKRAYDCFYKNIFPAKKNMEEVRRKMINIFDVPLPKDETPTEFGPDEMRAAFLGYLRFIKANLSGQTGTRVYPAWASQSQILQGFSELTPPDMVVREEFMEEDLAFLAALTGVVSPLCQQKDPTFLVSLDEIYNEEVESAVREIYARDYTNFGFFPMSKS